MKKIVSMFFKILMIIIILEIVVSTTSGGVEAAFWGEVFEGAEDFLKMGEQNSTKGVSNLETRDLIGILYNSLLTLGIIITIAIGGVLGIKFMMASAEDKAKIKESLVPYVVGCIVIYGAFGIWKMCINIFSAL